MNTIAPPGGQRWLAQQIRRLGHLPLRTVRSRLASRHSQQHASGADQGVPRIRALTQPAILLPDIAPSPPNGDEEVLGL